LTVDDSTQVNQSPWARAESRTRRGATGLRHAVQVDPGVDSNSGGEVCGASAAERLPAAGLAVSGRAQA